MKKLLVFVFVFIIGISVKSQECHELGRVVDDFTHKEEVWLKSQYVYHLNVLMSLEFQLTRVDSNIYLYATIQSSSMQCFIESSSKMEILLDDKSTVVTLPYVGDVDCMSSFTQPFLDLDYYMGSYYFYISDNNAELLKSRRMVKVRIHSKYYTDYPIPIILDKKAAKKMRKQGFETYNPQMYFMDNIDCLFK